MVRRRALFLDLGGTLVRLANGEIEQDVQGRAIFLPHVEEALPRLDWDCLFVITNQSGIARGTLSFDAVRGYMEQVNAAAKGRLTDWWACPESRSPFRKPASGMVVGLADKHFINLARSDMVGDSEEDRACAEAAGVGRFHWAQDFFSAVPQRDAP